MADTQPTLFPSVLLRKAQIAWLDTDEVVELLNDPQRHGIPVHKVVVEFPPGAFPRSRRAFIFPESYSTRAATAPMVPSVDCRPRCPHGLADGTVLMYHTDVRGGWRGDGHSWEKRQGKSKAVRIVSSI